MSNIIIGKHTLESLTMGMYADSIICFYFQHFNAKEIETAVFIHEISNMSIAESDLCVN